MKVTTACGYRRYLPHCYEENIGGSKWCVESLGKLHNFGVFLTDL